MAAEQKCEKCGKPATRVAIGIVSVMDAVVSGQPTGCIASIPSCDEHEQALGAEAEKRAQAQYDRDVPVAKAVQACNDKLVKLTAELRAMEREYKKSGALDNPNVPAAYAKHKDFVERYNIFKREWEQCEIERDRLQGRS